MIVIIDYQAGNLTSVVRSLKALGVEGTVTQDPAVVAQATRVIFPGVGAAGKQNWSEKKNAWIATHLPLSCIS